jgi:hypothetical protein
MQVLAVMYDTHSKLPEVLNSSHEPLFKLNLWLPVQLSACSSDVWPPLLRIILRQRLVDDAATAARQLRM